MPIKFLLLWGGGGWGFFEGGGGSADFVFMGAGIFLILSGSESVILNRELGESESCDSNRGMLMSPQNSSQH